MRSKACLLLAILVILPAGLVRAGKTSHWVHTTEADFKDGAFKNVVATNLGDLKLSRQLKPLLEQDSRVAAVFSLAQAPDGTIYAGTGPEGVLLAVKDDKISTAAEIGPHASLFSLLVDSKGRLLIGTGGEKGEIYRLDKPGEKPTKIFDAEDVQYIWAMVETPDGNVYTATGPNGQLFQINPDGTNKVLLDSDENNFLCLLSDGKDFLYAGTDPNGLVYRVNRHTGEFFIVYDAPEGEISALARDAKGNIYAGTAAASDEETPEDTGAAEQVGRPESETHGSPIPSQPPGMPKPPEVPAPAPGEPLPIPKESHPMSMLILAEPGDGPGIGEEPPKSSPATRPTRSDGGASGGTHKQPSQPSNAPANGNAIYRIDPDGFVNEIFRQPVSVFSILEHDGALLVATGDNGDIYEVNPAAEETLALAKTDSKDVLCLLAAKDGRVFMGLANSGDVASMSRGYASDGTFTSPVLDAGQISRFGKVQLLGTLPAGSKLTISTRSGNVEETTAPGWSKWSDEIPAAEFTQIASPSARFFQYRLTFSSDAGQATPVVEEVNVAYQVPNLAPRVSSIRLTGVESDSDTAAGGTGKITIAWDASDPNEDELAYTLFFRNGTRSPWILLKDKLKDPTFDWDTHGAADGRYEIKVEASDANANPKGEGKTASRVSDPIVVDNTAPVIGDVSSRVSGGDATIRLKAADRTTTVAKLEYSVDSSENWQLVLPSDKIADSPEEAYEFVVGGLSGGAHQVRVRCTDAKGNRSFETVTVSIAGPATGR
jgi:hypothetical protein